MRVSIDKYRFYASNNKIVAVSTYAGKTVRGIAKCDQSDIFSIEDGKALAMARCNEKVSKKRLNRAKRKFAEARDALIEAKRVYEKMSSYLTDSEVEHEQAKKDVADILFKLR